MVDGHSLVKTAIRARLAFVDGAKGAYGFEDLPLRPRDLAVNAVLRASLALATQPATGRYALPPVDENLLRTLARYRAAAVNAVFPGLRVAVPVG